MNVTLKSGAPPRTATPPAGSRAVQATTRGFAPVAPGAPGPDSGEASGRTASGEAATLAFELRARADRIGPTDPVGGARALVELGLHEERVASDRAAARRAYEAAYRLAPSLEPAASRVRRLLDGRPELATALAMLDDEIAAADDEPARADLLAERARTCDALGRVDDALVAYADALRIAPSHASSLRGLEGALRREVARKPGKPTATALAAHLERLAEAYAPGVTGQPGDAALAAWLHVERARVLDDVLELPQLARAALERAVELAPAPGPVRDALRRHYIRHKDDVALARALAEEARQEPDDDRASRLLYAAARLTIDKVGTPIDAIALLRDAASRAPESTSTARRALSELVRLLEGCGELRAAAEVRERRLASLTEPEAVMHEHARLAEIYDSLGDAERAADHAGRALARDPADQAMRERLDRALQRLGRHEDRVASWLAEAHEERPTDVRVAALRRAADISERHLGRRADAIAHLRAAWTIDAGNPEVFEALSALLAPPGRDPEADARGVRQRIDLYTQAAQAETETPRRIGLLEKLAGIWEDELCQPERAIEALDRILALDPKRRTAILALQRCAARAGDHRRLAEALGAEADLTADPILRRRLLLRAAEIIGERLGDRERALVLVDRALAIDASDPAALRLKFRLHDRGGRHLEAKKALLALIHREPMGPSAFNLWIEVALLDEHKLKRPSDAVKAYKSAARVKPQHPLPAIEVTRLLRDTGAHAELVEALGALASETTDPAEYARLLFQAAEVQELAMGDDDAALATLQKADTLVAQVADDPAVLESIERILVRRSARTELVAHYGRWLERHPPPTVDHALRIALAEALAPADPAGAIALLEGLVTVVPQHVPALRLLEQLHRKQGTHAALASTLRAQADVTPLALARTGALWEIAALEEHIGSSAALDALARVLEDAPADRAALDGVVRIASRLVDGVNVPHPAALATRARLVAAIVAKKELSRDPIARAMLELEEAILAEAQSPDDAAAQRHALAGYRAALELHPESLLAARGVERLSHRLGDRAAAIAAQRALARLVHIPSARASHLVRAAELLGDASSPDARAEALALYEEALGIDADNMPAAASLARLLASDPARLVDRLGAALERATAPDQTTLLGCEIARAILRQREGQPVAEPIDAGIGVAAMRRVLDRAPDDVGSLMLMARLLAAQQLWAEAREGWARVVSVARDTPSLVAAHFELAALYEGPLARLDAARSELEALLAIEPKNVHALERLYHVAIASGDKRLGIAVMTRLAEGATEPARRAELDVRLAEACRDAGDPAGAVRALCDALVCAPSDARAWQALASSYRVDKPDGATAYAHALQQLVELATSRRAPIDPRWLTTLGLIETSVLHRPSEGIAHLRQAVSLPNAGPDARVALGQGLMSAGRNVECVQVLRELLTAEPETLVRVADLSSALATLESALATDGRVEERLAIEEVRACLGEVKQDRVSVLRTRRLGPDAPYPGSLGGAELARLILPEARASILDVAIAIAPIANKALRFELSSLGIGSRERIGPRDGHPTRMLADRLARALGLEAFELYLSPTWQGAARVYPGDPPAIVGPTSFADLPEPEQAYALGRLLVRAALGMTWLDELSIEAVDGLLVAAMRAVDPQFALGELSGPREHAAQGFLAPVQRAIGRRQRKLLEEIKPSVTAAYDPRAFTIGVRRSEYRIAYLLGGDLLAAIDYLRRFDREIARSADAPRVLLQHPVTNELLRYAMTAEAFAERRRAGTIWSMV